jgi:hypothetical protein
MTRRRVLMVSPHFPPDTSAGAHRVRLLAPYLADYGWEPTVVTVDPAAYEGRLDPDLARLVPGHVRVIRAEAWSAGWTRAFGIGDLGLRSFTGLRRAIDELLAHEQFDALFITTYPTYPALLGGALKREHGLPFILDYQDPWVGAWGLDVGPGGSPDLKSRISRAIAQRLEPLAVRAADALTAVSARTYEDVLRRIPDARPRICAAIPLGVDANDLAALQQLPRANRLFSREDGRLHVSYVGTLLPKGRSIARAVCLAVAYLRDSRPDVYERLQLHFIGTSNQRDPREPARVLPMAAEAGVADHVDEIAPRVDYLDALNAQVQAHAVLLMGSSEPHYTPSKVFPALLTGRPIVGIYHHASPVIEVLRREPNARVIAVDDATPLDTYVPAIADALAWAVQAPGGEPRLRHDGSLEAWSASTLAGELAKVFDVATAPAGAVYPAEGPV